MAYDPWRHGAHGLYAKVSSSCSDPWMWIRFHMSAILRQWSEIYWTLLIGGVNLQYVMVWLSRFPAFSHSCRLKSYRLKVRQHIINKHTSCFLRICTLLERKDKNVHAYRTLPTIRQNGFACCQRWFIQSIFFFFPWRIRKHRACIRLHRAWTSANLVTSDWRISCVCLWLNTWLIISHKVWASRATTSTLDTSLIIASNLSNSSARLITHRLRCSVFKSYMSPLIHACTRLMLDMYTNDFDFKIKWDSLRYGKSITIMFLNNFWDDPTDALADQKPLVCIRIIRTTSFLEPSTTQVLVWTLCGRTVLSVGAHETDLEFW